MGIQQTKTKKRSLSTKEVQLEAGDNFDDLRHYINIEEQKKRKQKQEREERKQEQKREEQRLQQEAEEKKWQLEREMEEKRLQAVCLIVPYF